VRNLATNIKRFLGKTMPGALRKGADSIEAFSERKPQPTGGEWTKKIEYNPFKKQMTVNFQSGFRATYPNVDAGTFLSAKQGATTKDGRPGSVGAWLHQNPKIKGNYLEKGGN